MSAVAIITARGGSKRIPKKNIKEFCGKPIIAYSIEAALNSKAFDEVMVSTDSEEIKAVAESYGAKVPFLRSEAASNDFAVTADVIAEVLEQYEKSGKAFDLYACIYPTAPFVTEKKLLEAISLFNSRDAQSLVAVVPYSFPPQRAFLIRDGSVKYQYPKYAMERSQDLEKIYHDCGQFYFGRVKDFMKQKTLIMSRTIAYIISENEVQDIDTEQDWTLAELKFMHMHGNGTFRCF